MARSDAELVALTLSGRRIAFRELVMRYSAATYALVYSTLGGIADAEDIAQEVFLKAFENLNSLRKPERFGSWLYGITRNTCLAWLRKQGEPTVNFGDVLVEHLAADDPVGQGILERDERRGAVRRAVEELPEKYRVTVALKYLGGMTAQDIASELSISPSAVYARLSRARTILRGKLKSQSDDRNTPLRRTM